MLFVVCIFFADGKVFLPLVFSLPSSDDGKSTLCHLLDEKMTAETPPDGKLAVSCSDISVELDLELAKKNLKTAQQETAIMEGNHSTVLSA